MFVEAIHALGVVLDGIEDRAVVGGPSDGTCLLNAVGQHLAGAKILHLKRVLAEAGAVERIGQEMAIITHGMSGHRDELPALRVAGEEAAARRSELEDFVLVERIEGIEVRTPYVELERARVLALVGDVG